MYYSVLVPPLVIVLKLAVCPTLRVALAGLLLLKSVLTVKTAAAVVTLSLTASVPEALRCYAPRIFECLPYSRQEYPQVRHSALSQQ